MSDPPQADRRRLGTRAILICLFGRPCLKYYVQWSLAIGLAMGIFVCMWQIVPIVPKVTMHGVLRASLHAVSRDRKILLTTEDVEHCRFIQVWVIETGQLRLTIAPEITAVYLDLSPDATVFTVRDAKDRLTVWETSTGEEITGFEKFQNEARRHDPNGTRFSPDGRFLIIEQKSERGEQASLLSFWELETRTFKAEIEGELSNLTIAADGSQMAIQRSINGSPRMRLERWRLDADFPGYGPFQVHEVVAYELAVSPKLDRFASASHNEDPMKGDDIRLYDLASGKELANVEYRNPDTQNHLRFSPNGRLLTDDNPHRFNEPFWHSTAPPPLWDTEQGLKLVSAIAEILHISADDSWLLVETDSGNVDLYETTTFQKRSEVSVPGDCYLSLQSSERYPSNRDLYNFAPDGKTILVTGMNSNEKGTPVSQFLGQYISALGPRTSWSMPNVVRLWDVETAREIGTFYDCEAAMYSPDGKTLVTAYYDGTIQVWDVPPRKPIAPIAGLSAVLWLSIVVSYQVWCRILGWWSVGRQKKTLRP